MTTTKPIVWVGSSLAEIRGFPQTARTRAGYQLRRVQMGLMPARNRQLTLSVFHELGFDLEESQNLRIRSDLMIELSELIDRNGWSQVQAAEVMGVSQPRISNLVCGKIDLFSIDTLIAMLGNAGVRVRITTSASQVA